MNHKRAIGVLAAVVVAAAAGGAWYAGSFGEEKVWADPADRTLVRLGRAAYAERCATCHGANLEGQRNWRRRRADGTFPAPPHDASGHTWHHSDALLFRITKHGGQQGAPAGFVSGMPAFGDSLTDREIHAVLAYIKSRWPPSVRDRQEMINARAR